MKIHNLLSLTLAAGLLVAPLAASARPTGSYNRSGTVQGANGRGGTWQGSGTRTREKGSFQNNYQGTRTNNKGQTSTVDRDNNVTKTGPGSWHRDTTQSVTGPNGKTRTTTASGDGSVKKTENGYEKTYNGTVTNSKGQTVDVNKQVDVTKNADGTVTKERTVDYSTPEGKPLGETKSTTTVTPGQGSKTEGTYTNEKNGNVRTYNGSTVKTETGTKSTGTVTNPAGNTTTVESETNRNPSP